MCTAVDRVFPGYRINRLRAILGKISQARAAGRSRRVRQTPLHVHGASPALLVLLAARPLFSPARRRAVAARAGAASKVALTRNQHGGAQASLPAKAGPTVKRRFGSSLAHRLLPLGAARAYAPNTRR